METRVQLVAVIASGALLVFILELVRSRRMLERYALIWMGSAIALLALAAWTGLLERFSSAIGVATPSNALFLAAFGFVLILLLHFSIAVSRLSEQSKVLAQRLALIEERERRLENREARADTEAREREAVGQRGV